LLIKAVQMEKGWTVNRMIAEFPARQWKVALSRTLFISQICLKDFAVNFVIK